MGLVKKILGSLFPFTGTINGIYYERGRPFTGTITRATGKQDYAVRTGHYEEIEETKYEEGVEVDRTTNWEFFSWPK